MDLKSKRSRLGMSKSELARALGVTPGAVSSWERRGTLPRQATQNRIEAMLSQSESVTKNDGYATTYVELIENLKTYVAERLGIESGSVSIECSIH